MNDIATLRQVPLFSQMDDDELAALRTIMERHSYVPGQSIVLDGDEGDYFYVLLAGNVRFLTRDAGGHEIVLDEVGPGGFFGELSMLTSQPRSARVQALDAVTALALDRDEFFAFLQHKPHAAIDVLTVLAQRLLRTDSLLRQSVSRNVNDLADKRLSFGQRVADAIADFSGSIPFLVLNALWFGLWVLWNQPWFPGYDFDPFPFGLLTMIVSLEAIFLSIFLLISSNRQADKDRMAADIDHKVNAKAEIEIGLVLQRLDDIETVLHHHHRALAAQLVPPLPTDVRLPTPDDLPNTNGA